LPIEKKIGDMGAWVCATPLPAWKLISSLALLMALTGALH